MFSWADPTVHVMPIVVALGVAAWYLEATHRPGNQATSRQRRQFFGGLVFLILCLSWPLGDLAQNVSLLAIILQRQILLLGVAPLLMLGTPMSVTTRLTRPAPIDWITSRIARPVTAIATTTILVAVTALPWSISLAAHSLIVRGLIVGLNLFAGFVLWIPVIERVPGVKRLSDMGKAGYLIAQSVAPTFLSFAWIFALRPLYGTLHGQKAAIGISALADQQFSGYLSKLGNFGVLWTVSFILFARAADAEPEDSGALHWEDVERAIERAERQERRFLSQSDPSTPSE